MRGLFFASLLCIALYMQCIHAQWFKWVLEKGKTCEAHCKNKVKMCDPVKEFDDCKCFPQQLVDTWRQYYSLPIDPNVVCTYLMNSPKAPKCCSFYKKQKDNCQNHEAEKPSHLNVTMAAQEEEIEQLKQRLETTQDEMAKLSKKTTDLVSTLGEQNKELESMRKTLVSEPWKARTSSCPTGWSQYGSNCYYYNWLVKLDWHTSVTFCMAKDAYLVRVDNSAERDFITRMLSVRGDSYWTQGNDFSGRWTWHNANSRIEYSNWAPGEPNVKDEHCQVAWKPYSYRWIDNYCSRLHYCVCEKGLGA